MLEITLSLIKFFDKEEVMSSDKPKHVLLMVPGSIEILELADGGTPNLMC